MTYSDWKEHDIAYQCEANAIKTSEDNSNQDKDLSKDASDLDDDLTTLVINK
tara:strand:- start:2442 stop:2597 length:156 start_codon:yes stop_codon:yes gene_type:complete